MIESLANQSQKQNMQTPTLLRRSLQSSQGEIVVYDVMKSTSNPG